MHNAYSYVELWEQMKAGNHGLILWGKAGTGKSYFTGCIANALMKKEIGSQINPSPSSHKSPELSRKYCHADIGASIEKK